MTLDAPVLRARKPTAAVPWPLILVEGEEKSGKSWLIALLSSSPKIGRTFWLDLGEGAADEYAAIPGADYEVLEHDGTYAAVLEQVLAVKAVAREAAAAGQPPVVLAVDSASDIWNGLKDWVSLRAREKPSNRRKLAEDPAAELDVSRNLWNDAGNRYRRLMTQLLTFPGIVVVTARGKGISATDPETGQPYRDGRRSYAVESHKSLPYDATLWLRMYRTEPPQIIGARSVHAGVKPGSDEPVTLEGKRQPPTDNVLEWLTFDVLRCDPTAAHVRDLKPLTGGELMDDERDAELEEQAKAEAKGPAVREPKPAQQRRKEAEQGPPPSEPAPPPAQQPAQRTAAEELALPLPADMHEQDLAEAHVYDALRSTDAETVRGEFRDAADSSLLRVDVTRALTAHDARELELGAPPCTLGVVLMAVGRRLMAGKGPVIVDGPPEDLPPDQLWQEPPSDQPPP